MCADTEGWCNLKKQKQKACGWKNSLTNLVNVYGNSRKSESLLFDGLFYPKYIMSELKATEQLYVMALKVDSIYEENTFEGWCYP